MKLFEIIEPQELPQRRYGGTFRTVDKDEKNISSLDTDEKRIGSGFFSSVKSVLNDPHLVKKYRNRFGERDKYWDYADIIIKEKLWNNPYFPRLYTKQTYLDREHQELPIIKMEKLDSKINKKEALYLLDKMFKLSGKDLKEFQEEINENGVDFITKAIARPIAAIISAESETAFTFYSGFSEFRLDVKIKDPLLKQAINKLIEIKNEISSSVDLHTNNLMYRRGPTGVQVVITDPFSF